MAPPLSKSLKMMHSPRIETRRLFSPLLFDLERVRWLHPIIVFFCSLRNGRKQRGPSPPEESGGV